MTERFHLNCFNLSEVIVIRDGPDERGHHYVDGRHQISIAKFDTVEEAREFCDQHNSKLERPGMVVTSHHQSSLGE